MKGFIINHEICFQEENTVKGQDEYFIFGLLENGKNFIWQITQPHYIIFTAENLAEKYYVKKISNRFVDFYKNPLNCYFFHSKQQIFEVEKNYPHQEFYEKDISPINQYLMARGIKSQVEFLVEGEDRGDHLFFLNPPVRKTDFSLSPQFLNPVSIDIETGVEDQKLYSIALLSDNCKKVLLNHNSWENTSSSAEFKIEVFPNEKKLLLAFQDELLRINPHVIIGWNIVGFDFNFLKKKFDQWKIPFAIGINKKEVIHFIGQKSKKVVIKIPGRAFLEGMEVVRWFYPNLTRYSLENVSNVLLGEKKEIQKKGWEKVNEIAWLYQEKPEELAKYNFKDTQLVLSILEKIQGIDFMLFRTKLSGVTLERLKTPNDILDNLYLPYLHKKHYVSFNPPTKKMNSFTNNHLAQPSFQKGFYHQVWRIDFANILEEVIINYKVDPLAMVRATQETNLAKRTPRGFSFHQKDYILPYIIKSLNQELIQAQAEKKSVKIKAIQSLYKNIFLALGSINSRFFLPGIQNCLIENSLFIIEKIVNSLQEKGFKIIFFNSKSIIVQSDQLKEFSIEERKEIKTLLRNTIQLVITPIEVEKESLIYIDNLEFYPYFFLAEQDKKKNESMEFSFLAINEKQQVINHIYKKNHLPIVNRIKEQLILEKFKNKDLKVFLKEFKTNLLAGLWDEDLVYRERLYKKITEIKDKTSPVIEAALKMKDYLNCLYKSGFVKVDIEFIYSSEGVIPLLPQVNRIDFLKEKKIDYFHYLEKEIISHLNKFFSSTAIINNLAILKVSDFQLDFF